MGTEIEKILLNYGALGIMLILLIYAVIRLYKDSVEHRKEMKEISEKSTEAIRNNTDVLSALKTLLETNIRR